MPKIYKQGEVVLIPYPYTDLSTTKRRPVIIISKDSINYHDYIVAKITSNIRRDQFSFLIDSTDLNTPLHKLSEVRTQELFTMNESLVIRKFGKLHRPVLSRLLEKIKEHFEME